MVNCRPMHRFHVVSWSGFHSPFRISPRKGSRTITPEFLKFIFLEEFVLLEAAVGARLGSRRGHGFTEPARDVGCGANVPTPARPPSRRPHRAQGPAETRSGAQSRAVVWLHAPPVRRRCSKRASEPLSQNADINALIRADILLRKHVGGETCRRRCEHSYVHELEL